MGGLAFRAPVLATLFLIVTLATLAMPGSGNFVGEFLILLGVFNSKIVISIVAFSGVVMASVYALRLYIRSMHNRVGPNDVSRELRLADGLVLVPIVLVILFFAFYPQLALHRSEGSATAAVAAAEGAAAQPSALSADAGWSSYVPIGGASVGSPAWQAASYLGASHHLKYVYDVDGFRPPAVSGWTAYAPIAAGDSDQIVYQSTTTGDHDTTVTLTDGTKYTGTGRLK
jgi:NADH:ubiquinone oxidoreductase subunit 5 (subunit L)/multisubunit Na+/H+ antiporter MnhA subunit